MSNRCQGLHVNLFLEKDCHVWFPVDDSHWRMLKIPPALSDYLFLAGSFFHQSQQQQESCPDDLYKSYDGTSFSTLVIVLSPSLISHSERKYLYKYFRVIAQEYSSRSPNYVEGHDNLFAPLL